MFILIQLVVADDKITKGHWGHLRPGIIVAQSSSSPFLIATALVAGTMPRHACIFCPKSYSRLSQVPVSVAPPGHGRSAKIRRTAVPVFLGRVSPVLDTCTQLFMLDSADQTEPVSPAIPMKGSIFERAREIQRLGIDVIICGAVGDSLYNLLKEAGIDLVCGITGDIDEVIEAYRKGALEQPQFRMPGSD